MTTSTVANASSSVTPSADYPVDLLLESPYSTRPATADDFDLLRSIHRAAMTPSVTVAMGCWDDDFQGTRLGRHFQHRGLQFLLDDNTTVGCVHTSNQIGADDASELFLEQFYLLPQVQGTGLAGRVLRSFQSHAQSTNQRIVLHVLKESPARAFYEHHGFVKFGEDPYQDYLAWSPLSW